MPSYAHTPSRPRVLVVEDSATQAEHLRTLLADTFDVQVAPDGQRALTLFDATDFDLVLTDVVMPGLSGFDVCRRMKETPRRHVPVVLLAELSNPEAIVRGIECGADAFIPKPYHPPNLIERIRGLLLNRSLRGPKRVTGGVEVQFLGKKFTITSEKEQIIDLLLSTCEEVVGSHEQLRASEKELRAAQSRLESSNRELRGQVRSTTEKHRALMTQANDANFILDPAGNVLEVNRRAEELLGRPGIDIVGCLFGGLLVRPGDREWLPRILAGESVRADDVLLLRDGVRPVWVDLSASSAEVGDERFLLVVARDITDRRRLEEQFLQTQKMEAFGQLAAGVAHDFNNLLTVINGYGELVRDSLPADAPGRENVGEIIRAGDRAATLTRQLLAFSRRQVIAPTVLDLNAVLAETGKMLGRLIGEDIDLVFLPQGDLGRVEADAGQVEQVMMNLAVNARDAMPTGGKLTVETRNVELDEGYAAWHAEARPGRHVLVTVSDIGCGMTEEVKARVFEPFFTTKEKGRGTGLGLSMVFGFVKQSGGHVEVYSEPGVGTSFKIYLPRVEAAPTPRKSSLGPARTLTGTETILLAEDDTSVRALTRTVLRGCGYAVLESSDGEDASSVARGNYGTIHLLVSDVVMPGMGGRQLAEQLLTLHPRLKVLFLSGYTDDAVIRHGILHDRVNFLQKPFSATGLARKVREVLDTPC